MVSDSDSDSEERGDKMDQNMIYILFICIMVPMLLMFPLLAGRSRLLVGFMMIGIFACLFAAGVNGYIRSRVDFDMYYITTNLTPVTEEIIKALPILYYAFLFDSKKEKLIPLAFAVGVGFAVLENMIILTQNIATVSIVWAVIRGFASGLMHGICTAFVMVFCVGFVSIYHSIFNTLVQSESYKYWGFVLPISTYIPLVLFFVKNGKAGGWRETSRPASSDGLTEEK